MMLVAGVGGDGPIHVHAQRCPEDGLLDVVCCQGVTGKKHLAATEQSVREANALRAAANAAVETEA